MRVTQILLSVPRMHLPGILGHQQFHRLAQHLLPAIPNNRSACALTNAIKPSAPTPTTASGAASSSPPDPSPRCVRMLDRPSGVRGMTRPVGAAHLPTVDRSAVFTAECGS